MIDKTMIADVAADFLKSTDGFLVDVKIDVDNNITVEFDSYSGVDIDTCAALSRRLNEALEGVGEEDYSLEVGSAGLTAPLKVRGQFEKNVGNEVEVLTTDGRKLRGTLVSVSADNGSELEFTLEMQVKTREPGKKKPVIVTQSLTMRQSQAKSVRYMIDFK